MPRKFILSLVVLTLTSLPNCGGDEAPVDTPEDPVITYKYFLYAVNREESTIFPFEVDAAYGTLTGLAQSMTDTHPDAIAVTPNGRYLFTGNAAGGTGTVSVFSISRTAGTLTVNTS